jgi:hypothetical protein
VRSGWNPADKAAADARSKWAIDTSRHLQTNYGANYARLVDVKTKHDPKNLFLGDANVSPKNPA